MLGIDRFGVLITDGCHRFRIDTPAQLTAACGRAYPDRIPTPMLDAIAADAERFGNHHRRGLDVATAHLVLAGLQAREVGALTGWAIQTVWKASCRGRKLLARRGHQGDGIEARIRTMIRAGRGEARQE